MAVGRAEIEIDGGFGEGGGQILRTALSLSLLTGKSFRIHNLRAKREKPGLRPQHLAAVSAAVRISGSEAKGAEIGSRELIFSPAAAKAGNYKIDIGTAGSTGLVFQTLLPALANLGRESRIEIKGGTHNPKSPCFHFLKEVFLPVLSRVGINAEAELSRYGFYPRGGGDASFRISPWKNRKNILKAVEPVIWEGPRGEVLLAGLEAHIAEREQDELCARLDIGPEQIAINFLPSDMGPGNAVLLRYAGDERAEIITGYGEPGKRAEKVAAEAAREAKNFARSRAQFDSNLADQVLIYLVMAAGGEFTTNALTSHFHTNLKIIRDFLKVGCETKALAADLALVQIRPA